MQINDSPSRGAGQVRVNPLDLPISFTRFPDLGSKTKKEVKVSLRALAPLIEAKTAESKDRLRLFSGLTFGCQKTLKGSLRSTDNALSVFAVFGDYDAGLVSPEDAVQLLQAAGLAALVYTTPSNMQGGKGHRWRVVLALGRARPTDEYYTLVARVNGALGGILADESFKLSQSFYMGGVVGNKARTILVDGRFLDEATELDDTSVGAACPPSAIIKDAPQEAVDQSGLPRAVAKACNMIFWAKKKIVEAAQNNQSRTHAIYGQAFHLGGYVACNTISEEDARTALIEAAEEVGYLADYSATELDRHISKGLNAGIARPIPWSDPADTLELDDTDVCDVTRSEEMPVDTLSSMGGTGLSAKREAADRHAIFGDIWNGARHADRVRGRNLYVSASGQWLTWTGQRWAAMTAENVVAGLKETSAAIFSKLSEEFRKDPSPDKQAAVNKAAKLHGNAQALARMEQMARSEPGMSVASAAEFDRNPWELACHNGIVDLRTGILRAARPEDRVSKLAGCAFDLDAECPMFERFLERVLPDPQLRAFFHRVVGYTLTGSIDEEVFFLAFGKGQNGKSIFANLLSAVMGEYSSTFGAALVTLRKHDNESDRQVSQLPGVRLALVNETAQGEVWNNARMKELASRERISARLLHKEIFHFLPTHKLWIRTNHLPGSLDSGDGFWRRCIPIPFTVTIPDNEKIPDLDRKITAAELPGVMAWAVRGASEWSKQGLAVPRSVKGIIAEYREDTDILGMWMDERTIPNPDGKVAVGEAFSDYADYCKASGLSAGSKPTFSRAMTDKGIARAPGKTPRRFVGFDLRSHLYSWGPDDENMEDANSDPESIALV